MEERAASATSWRTSSSAAKPPSPLHDSRALPPRPSATPPAPAFQPLRRRAPRPSPDAPRATRPGRGPRPRASPAAAFAKRAFSLLVLPMFSGKGAAAGSAPRRQERARASSARPCGVEKADASTGGGARRVPRGRGSRGGAPRALSAACRVFFFFFLAFFSFLIFHFLSKTTPKKNKEREREMKKKGFFLQPRFRN